MLYLFIPVFRWLYTEIVRKDGGDIPEELKRTSQQVRPVITISVILIGMEQISDLFLP